MTDSLHTSNVILSEICEESFNENNTGSRHSTNDAVSEDSSSNGTRSRVNKLKIPSESKSNISASETAYPSRKKNISKKMVDTDRQKETMDKKVSSQSKSSESQRDSRSQVRIKEEVISDGPNSPMSDINPPSLATRSRRRRLERRKAHRAASSNSSAFDSDARKTRSEPILITLDSDSDDNISIVACRPNRTARIRGEIIRQLSVGHVRSGTRISYKDSDSSSSSENEKVKRKRRNKSKSMQMSSAHSETKKYLVKRLANKKRIKLKPLPKNRLSRIQKTRHLNIRSLRKRFERQKNETKVSKRSNPLLKSRMLQKSSQVSTNSVERRRMSRRNSNATPNDNLEKVSNDKEKNEKHSLDKERIEKNEKPSCEKEKIERNEKVSNDKEKIEKSEKVSSDKEKVEKIEENEVKMKTDEASYKLNSKPDKESLKPEKPSLKPEKPSLKPERPSLKPERPSLKPERPCLKPERPSLKPEKPSLKPEKPPDIPIIKTEFPAPEPLAKVIITKSSSTPAKIVRRAMKKIKPVDKIIRKRGRPRLYEPKQVKSLANLDENKHVPFLQSTFCFNIAPRLPKCRECRIAGNRNNRRMFNSYCRFMEYRKLCYSKSGVILNSGFSEPSDATSEHLNQWLPQLKDPPKDLNCETAKSLLEHIGDQFCDLIEQEKEALSLHIGKDSVITWKRIVQGVREMCDVCYTTIFNIHWVCPICGLTVCIDCYKVRKQGIIVEDDEDQPKNRDEYKWLLCTMRVPHQQDKLVMAQIIPGSALWTMRELLHKARKKWNIPSYCKCNPQEVSAPDRHVSTGICKQLMSFVTKAFTNERAHSNLNSDTNMCNNESSYDDLDIEISDTALKWLEGTNICSDNMEGIKQTDDHFHSYEDFAILRGSLLQDVPEEESATESEREFSSFSLDDIIACVTKPPSTDGKEGSEKTLVKHFSQRYPQANSGRDPLPIRIYTKIESDLAFSNVPHSWFCNGRLLFLHKADHKDNLALFQEQWKRGQPILVKGVEERLDMTLWHPDGFCRDFGEVKNDLVDCKTGAVIKNLPMKRFWEGFETFGKRMKDENGEYMLLKLKDWPPGEDFSEKLPKRFHDLMRGLPLPEYTHRDGVLNLAGRLPPWFVRPDLGPKMYNAYGSALYPAKGTTNLHLDVSDAVNVMVYVGIPSDGNAQAHIQEALKAIDEGGCDSLMRARVRARAAKPGALWHIYNARDADKIREMLTKVAIERGEKLEAHHDPIHDQSWYIDAELRKRLYRDYGVEGYAIAQCLGDAVFIPAGAPHQVRNLHSCVKVAEDFVSPENIAHCFKLTQEFRHLSDTHTNHEDKLQIKNIIYHVVRDALAHLLPEESES